MVALKTFGSQVGDGVTLALALGEADGVTLAEGEADGVTLAEGEADGVTLALGDADGVTLAVGVADGVGPAPSQITATTVPVLDSSSSELPDPSSSTPIKTILMTLPEKFVPDWLIELVAIA